MLALLRGRISVRGAPCAGEAQTLEAVASAGLEPGGGGVWEQPGRGRSQRVLARPVWPHSLLKVERSPLRISPSSLTAHTVGSTL